MKVDQFFAFRNRGDESKPFLSHLEDLRFTIVKIAIALILAMVACFLFRNELAAIVQHPLIAVDPQRAANLQSSEWQTPLPSHWNSLFTAAWF